MDDYKHYGSSDNDIDSLGRSVKIVSGVIGIKFGIDNCAVLKMKRRKQVQYEEIDLGEDIMEEKADQEGYKYLETLGRENVCQDEMKEMLRKEYFN